MPDDAGADEERAPRGRPRRCRPGAGPASASTALRRSARRNRRCRWRARVRSGPGDTAKTRMPRGPSSVRQVAHRGLQRRLHRTHHVVVAAPPCRRRGSVMVISVPPLSISGSARRAMRMNEWQETSIACRKPAASSRRRGRAGRSRGAKAIEWRTKSSRPQSRADPLEHRLHLPGWVDVQSASAIDASIFARQRLDVAASSSR